MQTMKAGWFKAALSGAILVAAAGAAQAAPVSGIADATRTAAALTSSAVTSVHWRKHHRWHRHRGHRHCGYVRRCGYWGCRIVRRCHRH